jgi:hypothetical protein
LDHSGGPIYTLFYQKEQRNMAADWEQIRKLRGCEVLLAGLELEDLL